jgi:hypothetical protein
VRFADSLALFERFKRNRLQRHRAAARLCLRALRPTLRERAMDVNDARLKVEVRMGHLQ